MGYVRRRFELAGSPGRFWEVTIHDDLVTMRWGTIGTPGQGVDRRFAAKAELAAYVEKQVALQRSKNYVEVAQRDRNDALAETPIERRERFERKADRRTGGRDVHELEQRGRELDERVGIERVDGYTPDPEATRTRTFDTVAEASRAYDELRDDLRYQGYDLARPGSRITARTHSNPELEAMCLASLDSPVPWQVYTDWLIGQGDPRGELAALHLAGNRDGARAYWKQHVDVLWGRDERVPQLEFRHGYVSGMTITLPDGDLSLDAFTRAVLALPLARFVTSLRFGPTATTYQNDWGPTMAAVTSSVQAAQLRELAFTFVPDQAELSWIGFGDFSSAWSRLPALEYLFIRSGAGGKLGTLDLPRLKTFIRESGGLAAHELASITRATWPELEHLEIWFGSRHYGAVPNADALAALAGILDARGLPKLRHLGIVNAEFTHELLPVLVRSKILRQLDSLDLSKGVLSSESVAVFERHADAFRHLAELDLEENLLSRDDTRAIRAVLDNAVVSDQRERDDDDGDDEDDDTDSWRYAAIGE
ncbi:MAG TPA: WGR domain-containing protein [Kofleriaceae bacterium]|nr:WGR domain-containing protein [Kofleriaceae bacterium]